MQGSTTDGSAVPPQVVLGLGSGLSRKGPMADTWTKDRKFELLVSSSDGISSPGTEVDLQTRMQQAQSALEAQSVVEGFLKTSVASAIGSSVEAVDGEKPLYDFGGMSLHLRIRCIPTIS
jgi:hypothetical protein